MKFVRWLLLPFSWLYGLVIIIRNWCFDTGWISSTAFDLPVIVVGNLAVGGAGKTPMTEHLIGLLSENHKIATLSRGYGRRTSGFLVANEQSTAADVGDEPSQFKTKFPGITVAVCEDRVEGINRLKSDHDVIILDDAYQHRAVKPGFSILLIEYNSLRGPRFLLPAGNFREPLSSKMRADIIVISKCPPALTEQEREKIATRLNLLPYQSLFFTAINYQKFHTIDGRLVLTDITPGTRIYLLTGIAGTRPIKQYLRQVSNDIVHHKYPDHHQFSTKNIAKLARAFSGDPSPKKAIVTTEKDAERLKDPELLAILGKLNLLILPIKPVFLEGEERFNNLITDYVRQYTTHNNIH